jgi:hypothetical protein
MFFDRQVLTSDIKS